MRVLVATVPLTGHVHPMLLVVRALVAAGHEVVWSAASKFRSHVESAGARHVISAPDWDDGDVEAALPALRGKRGLARVRAQLAEMFIAPMQAQLADLGALADRVRPDVVLADQAHLGAMALCETRGLPWAGLGISALVVPSRDLSPFGSARPPGDPPIVNRIMRWVVDRLLFRATHRAYARTRAACGLPPGGTYFEVLSPDLFLQPTIAEFEYPRSDLPPQVQFIGPLLPQPSTQQLPAWWPDVLAATRPIVLVTQGTLATDPRELIVPAITALQNRDVLAVVTSSVTPAQLGLGAWPANVRVAPFVPYAALLARASLMVTNGGYGGVQMALGAGVPLVVAGGSEEKPEIAARVAWCGAGVDLRTGRPSAKKLGAAISRVLDEPAYAARAKELAAIIARTDAATSAVTAIEQLVARRAHQEAA